MKIVIPGNPIPKARHRDGMRYGNRVKYDPQQEKKEKIGLLILSMAKNRTQFKSGNAFVMNCIFHMPIPESDSQTVRNLKLWGLIPHNIKPDSSNMLKFYEDAANKILYQDDSMLVDIRGVKRWSENPRTEIDIVDVSSDSPEEVKILSMISPENFFDMLVLINELSDEYKARDLSFDFYSPERDELRKKTASVISEISDKFGKDLHKISNKFPGYWQKKEI